MYKVLNVPPIFLFSIEVPLNNNRICAPVVAHDSCSKGEPLYGYSAARMHTDERLRTTRYTHSIFLRTIQVIWMKTCMRFYHLLSGGIFQADTGISVSDLILAILVGEGANSMMQLVLLPSYNQWGNPL